MSRALIIIGGYNSIWPVYLKLARDLEDLSGLRAVGVPLMPWDWWQANRAQDASNLLAKVAETVAWARRRFRAEQFILVGHSAGGLLGRLYLSDQPLGGQIYAGLEHVAALITLGSPHASARGEHSGWFLTDQANRLAPGAAYAECVRYLSVAGRFMRGRQDGSYRERRAFRAYQFFDGRGGVWGDGAVPVETASLEGAETIVLEGVAHSRKFGPHWYGGSKAVARRWWPPEVQDAG